MRTEIADGWSRTINEDSLIPRESVVGKYLFFSDDKAALVFLGERLLLKYDLPSAKVPTSDIPNRKPGFGFVLCVFSNNSDLRNELKSYETAEITYRYFKSNEATIQGKYSKGYLKQK